MKVVFLISLFLISFLLKAQDIKSIHLLNYNSDKLLLELSSKLEGFAKKGINTIFLEVDYGFDFKSHPELILNNDVITKKGAEKFTSIAASFGIKIIPQFQSLGHQSWAENTGKFLTVYPELDLTPGFFPNNDSIYCREWDVMNPKVNEIIFPLIDEIIEAFNSEGIHIGMDEVFLLGHPQSPNTKGMNPAYLFGKVVREFHDYFTIKNGKQIYMWGDRFINASKYGYGSWEASTNGTWPAIDSVPKDIIICDWHYLYQKEYPSIDLFLEKGFRVLPTSYKDVDAVKSLISYSYAKKDTQMIGHMFTTWGSVSKENILDFPAMNLGLLKINEGRFYEVFINSLGSNESGELLVEVMTSNPNLKIAYSTDGIDPSPDSNFYSGAFVYRKNTIVKAVSVKNGSYAGEISEADFTIHKAIGKSINLVTTPGIKYASGLREKILLNGVSFTGDYKDGEWLGFEGKDAEFIIDLGDTIRISKVSMNFHNKVNDLVHHSNHVIILGSVDGKAFSVIGERKLLKTGRPIVNVKVSLDSTIRFIKVIAKNQIIPDGFNGAGNPAWIYIDEVQVN